MAGLLRTLIFKLLFVLTGIRLLKALEIHIEPTQVFLTSQMPPVTSVTCTATGTSNIKDIVAMQLNKRHGKESKYVALIKVTPKNAPALVDTILQDAPEIANRKPILRGGIHNNTPSLSTLVMELNTNTVTCADAGEFQCLLVYTDISKNVLTEAATANLTVHDTPLCGNQWELHGTKCFLFVTRPMNWNDARSYCKTQGSDLAVIKSAEEQSFIVEHGLTLKLEEFSGFWLGYHDINTEGHFEAVDGHQIFFTAWGEGEPNNLISKEDCVGLRTDITPGWNDFLCDLTIGGTICSKNAILQPALSMIATKKGFLVTGGTSLNPAVVDVGDDVTISCTGKMSSDNRTNIRWRITSELSRDDDFIEYYPTSLDNAECTYSQTASVSITYRMTAADANRENSLIIQCYKTVNPASQEEYEVPGSLMFYIDVRSSCVNQQCNDASNETCYILLSVICVPLVLLITCVIVIFRIRQQISDKQPATCGPIEMM